ncbi:MAG: hypothetical protein V7606_127 [Burkholderiales bacterium]|jgi:hypothetical protein
MGSQFKPPLFQEQLAGIQARNRDNPDVEALLWEIKRLHALVLKSDQLQRSLGNVAGSGAGLELAVLRDMLRDEPCVKESQGWAQRRKRSLAANS